ncbi:MAG: hypothetical protein V4636_13090 [Pseudomonadota bacterium]
MSVTPTTKPQQTMYERVARLDVTVLTPIGKSVLKELAAFADRYSGKGVWCSLARIVDEVGFCHGSVLAAVKHLHAIGALIYDETIPRPPGIDKRVKGRAIVIDHLPATSRSVHQVDRSKPKKIRPPGGLGSVHQVDPTVPSESSTKTPLPSRARERAREDQISIQDPDDAPVAEALRIAHLPHGPKQVTEWRGVLTEHYRTRTGRRQAVIIGWLVAGFRGRIKWAENAIDKGIIDIWLHHDGNAVMRAAQQGAVS